jgi:hypothetical protein
MSFTGLNTSSLSSVSSVAIAPPVTWTSASATARVCSGVG